MVMEPSLKTYYSEKVAPALKTKLAVANVHQIPRVEKVVINCSFGKAPDRKQAMEDAVNDLQAITGQKPVVTRSRKAISNFKLREGEPLGVKVTLRGRIMWEFLERLMKMALPVVRDFRGVSGKSFDGRGNYTLGVREQIIFPEISFDKIDAIRGMDITIVTTARNDEEGRALLREMGMPFRSN
jgi:large subunit ribosomal protein L5